MQFSLKAVFFAVTFASVAAWLGASWGALGLSLSFALLGLVVAAHGAAKKRLMQTLIGLGFVATTAGVLYVDMSGGVIWDGQFTLVFDVTVLDADTSAPVPDAELAIGSRGLDFATHRVDRRGKAQFSHTFPCGGHDSALGITRSSWKTIPLKRYWLKVRTKDGTEQIGTLADAVGLNHLPRGDSALPPIVLWIQQQLGG